MKKSIYLAAMVFALVACTTDSNSQTDNTENQTEETVGEAKSSEEAGLPITSFIPKGYEILQEAKGKLNADAGEDVVLILKKSNEDDLYNGNGESSKRKLIILFSVDGQGYEQVAESDNAVFTLGDGGAMGDAFSGITVKDGYFTIEHMGGAAERWTRFITFKNDNGQFFLDKDISEGFSATNPDKVSYNHTKTTKNFGKVSFESFNIQD